MIKNVTINRNTNIKSNIDSIGNLSYYAKNNIPNYNTITEIPKEHINYINSIKYANNCYHMFYNCKKLLTLDLSNFNTSYVTDMAYMFNDCGSLTTLNVSRFNTSNVTDMNGVFDGCQKLTTINISNFDTSKVDSMNFMFARCGSLTTIRGTLDLSSCHNVVFMFYNTPNLRRLHLKNVPRSLLDTNGSLRNARGTLNQTYIIDNILENR